MSTTKTRNPNKVHRSKHYMLSVVIHSAFNLPKADTLGKISAYVRVKYDGKTHDTPVVSKNYDPKWNSTFVVHTDLGKTLELELWDKKMLSDELIGTLNVTLPDTPHHKTTAEWKLTGKYHPHISGSPCTVTYSVGWVRDMNSLDLQRRHSHAKIIDKNRAIVPVGKKLLGVECINDEDLILCIEYSKSKVDIMFWETTTKYRDLKLFELAYSYTGIKYTSTKKTWITPCEIAGFPVFSELKLDNIPFFYDFSKLTLSVSTATLLERFTGATIYDRHGWKDAYDYEQAKKHVSNIYSDDKHKRIMMLEENGVFVVDFSQKEIDFTWGVYTDHATKGIVADMAYTKHEDNHERIIHYFGKPKEVLHAKVGMNISVKHLEGITDPVRARDFEITLWQKQLTNNFAVAQFLPLIDDTVEREV